MIVLEIYLTVTGFLWLMAFGLPAVEFISFATKEYPSSYEVGIMKKIKSDSWWLFKVAPLWLFVFPILIYRGYKRHLEYSKQLPYSDQL